MSHSHSHAPGEQHSHSHSQSPLLSPQTPLTPQTPQTPHSPHLPSPDPTALALIEQDFRPVSLKLGADNHIALCEPHGLEKCTDCNVDFQSLNRMSRILANNPNLRCPPPVNVITQKLTQLVTSTKDEGNALFKKGLHVNAIQKYAAAASFAIQRPPWEANQRMREELTTIMSNRSAAFYEAGDYVAALADAEFVIQLRRNWSKGHFRKAKALHALNNIPEACDAVRLGLSFEPNNQELAVVLSDLLKAEIAGADSIPATPVTA
ncbi:hypothetical protein JOM56_007272 [Amanita muscaria]